MQSKRSVKARVKKVKKRSSNLGGARPGAGRKKRVNDGVVIGVFVGSEDLKKLTMYAPGVARSAFFRSAGKKELEQLEKRQLKLEL